MRLWHKALIPVLPRQQLLGQWRECCLIAKNIAEKGTPNHILVNRVMDYPNSHLDTYAKRVYAEIVNRGYKCDWRKYAQHRDKIEVLEWFFPIFEDWHNDRYLRQCCYNLQEKYDCGGITEEEWNAIEYFVTLP